MKDYHPPPIDNNGWTQYQKLVLNELERLSEESKDIKEHLSKIHIEIAMLKVKSGVWGALAGAITILIGIAIKYFSSMK